MTMADTVAVMEAGRIVQLGAPAELYEFPVNAFVANFLGQSNLLAGDATGVSGDEVAVTVAGARYTVSAGRSRAVTGPVWLGVRPEKLNLATDVDQVPAGHQHVTGVVTDASYVGVSTQYVLRTTVGAEVTVFVANTGNAEWLPLGASAVAHWRPAHAFLLPREGGNTTSADVAPAGVAIPTAVNSGAVT